MNTLLLALTFAAQGAPLRHALVVGSNDGGTGLERLRYAEDDATRMANLLVELGGFDASQVTVLRDPTTDSLRASLEDHARTAAAEPDDFFLFYYSGHADVRGLRLKQDVMSFEALRTQVGDLDSTVRVGVLDACRSGEITGLKGLEVEPPFATEDELEAEGEAWLTATSADEAAQESDRIRGSFFTHYLLSALRGAADQGDGIVSLGEAYAYVYDRTVVRTGATSGGTQHPGYDFRIQGQGDLPLTDVRNANASLILPANLSGELVVSRLPDRTPIAEVALIEGIESTLALPPGSYALQLRDQGVASETRLGLAPGATLTVDGFKVQPIELALNKGGQSTTTVAPTQHPVAVEPVQRTRLQEFAAETRNVWDDIRMLGTAARRAVKNRTPIEDEYDEIRHGVPPEIQTDVLVEVMATDAVVACADRGDTCLQDAFELETLPNGPVRLTYEDGSTAVEGLLLQGAPSSYWTFWYPNGEKQCQGAYVSGRKAGHWTCWYDNGERRYRGDYDFGSPTGTWTTYYVGGSRHRKVDVSAGKPDGKVIQWYPNGKRQYEGRQQDAIRQGNWTFWYDNGERKEQGRFVDGNRNGTWTEWFINGKKSGSGTYRDDVRDGDWVFWWENGERSAEGVFISGEKSGRWLAWHYNGETRSKGSYVEGLRFGKWTEWSETGRKNANGHYLQDKKVGRWTYWDERGRRSVSRL